MSRSPPDGRSIESARPYAAAFRTIFRMYEKGKSWSGHERNCAYLNTGQAPFADVSAISGLDVADDGRAVALVDWDHDGDLDLWIANRTAPQLRFFHNRADNGHHFLALRLEGRSVNRDAIGARVRVDLRAPDGEAVSHHKTLYAGSGYLAQSSKWLHFGLGEATQVERLVVDWPGGEREEVPGVDVDRRYRLIEGSGGATAESPRPRLELGPGGLVEAPPAKTAGRVFIVARAAVPPLPYRTDAGAPGRLTLGGSGPTLLNLWAAWCLPCRGELGELTRRQEEIRRSGLRVMALSVDGLDPAKGTGDADAHRLLEELGFPYDRGFAEPELLDTLQVLSDALFSRRVTLGVPTSFLITDEGEVAAIYRGPVDVDQLLADLDELDAPLARRRELATPFAGRWHGEAVALPASWVAQRYLDEDLLDPAIWSMQRALRQQSDDAGVYTRIADLQFRKGELDAAEASYRRALALQDDDVRALRHLADLLHARGRIPEALPLFQQAAHLEPDTSTTRYNYGNALLEVGRLEAAAAELRAAIAADPGYADAYNNLGTVLARRGEHEAAAEAFRRTIELRPDSADALNNLGTLLAQRGETAAAFEHFERAIEAHGDFAEAHNNLGVLLSRRGELAAAIEHFEQALAARPDFAEARDNLAGARRGLAARRGDGDPPAGGGEERDGAEASGHRRMVELLARLATETAHENPYYSRDELATLRRRLTELGPTAALADRLLALTELGIKELVTGSTDEAVARLSTAYRLVPRDATGPRTQIGYYLGLAHLRRAERANCVAHHSRESCLYPLRGGGVHVLREETEKAIAIWRETLQLLPPGSARHLATKWLLNLAVMATGVPVEEMPTAERIAPETWTPTVDFPRFVDAAPDLGLDLFDWAGGAIVEDFSGDGLLDIMTSTWEPSGSLRYFERSEDGRFRERTTEAGLEGLTGGLNLVQADYDNDGDADVLVLRGGWLMDAGRYPNSLLRNDGGGGPVRFTDVTFATGLGDVHYPTQTGAWADYDNDGDLDLYVGNESLGGTASPSQLFRNEGDGTFTDVASVAGVENLRYAKAVVWGDYDGDRLPDLFVSNYAGENRLYRNQGRGSGGLVTFVDVAPQLGLTRPLDSFTSWFWDFDNDGHLDLYVGGYQYAGPAEERLFPVVASRLGLPPTTETDRLFRGDGRGGFEDVSQRSGLARVTMPMGANYGDLDNDGFLDAYLGTGWPDYDALVPNVLYRNLGGERFVDVTTAAGMGHLQKGHGVAFADFDNDGDQDVFEQMGGFFPDDAYGNVLYENPGFGNRWIKIALRGITSNRAAIGARIRIDLREAGAARSIHRRVGTGGSFGAHPLTQHIGLGQAEKIERLEVYWPTSGARQAWTGVAVDQAIEVTEGEPVLRVLPHRSLPFLRRAPAEHDDHR